MSRSMDATQADNSSALLMSQLSLPSDRVRASSAFLYSTIIAVSTRYGTTTAEERETNQQCWALVRNHIKMSAL